MMDTIIDTLKTIPVKDVAVASGAVGLSFIEWLPFWLRIITMVITVVYMGAKAWNEIKKMR